MSVIHCVNDSDYHRDRETASLLVTLLSHLFLDVTCIFDFLSEMVLSKRKRDESVVANPLPDQSQMSMQADPSMMPPDASKRTRTNPRRSSRVAATSELPAKTPKPSAAKKARVSRAKQLSAPSQPTTQVLPVVPEAGSSQIAAPPPPKRGRKKAAPAAEDASGSQTEKRGAVFKSKCPQNILDRVERVMTQRCVVVGFTYSNSKESHI